MPTSVVFSGVSALSFAIRIVSHFFGAIRYMYLVLIERVVMGQRTQCRDASGSRKMKCKHPKAHGPVGT